uniref:Ubiquitin-like protease family profile domain-containing protein n=1 Tax=Triticum urartu TaxID=4572 RepID=A0A8R7TT57_TRIUA
MPLVTATISNVPCQEKHKLPQKVVQTSKKRPSDQSIDENLIKRIKKLEDHYTAERQKLITLSKRKLQNNLQQLEIKKTKEMAALVQEEIHKAMLPMNDDARAGSSLHNDDPTLTKGSIGTESPCHSNLDEVVLLSAKSAQCGHQTSTHVDAIPQLTAGTPSSPTFMNEIVQIGTHESPPATNLVNKENVKLDNFHPASSFVGQITQYEPSSSKEIIPTDQIVQAEPAACKDPFMERQETIERQDTFVANVLPASNICAVPHQPDLVPAVIIPTSSFILPNKDGDQVHSHIVEAEKNNIPSEDSSMLKIVGTDVQADTASVVPVSTNITGPGQGYPGDQPESNVFVVEHAKHDSIINVLHEVRNTVTTPTTVDVIPDTDFIAPKSTESASEILVADAHKATNMDSLAHNAASDVIQLQHTDKTTLEDEFQNQSNKQFGNLDVSKNEIESKKDIEIADSHATLKDVADISSPPLSIEIVGDVSIMSVSQMTREYDRMNVPGAATIDTTEHIAASTLHEVSRPEDTDKLIQPQHIVFETSVLPDHRSSSLDVLQIDHSNLLSSMPKPSTQPPGITLQIGQTSPKESSAMQDSDQKLLDKCVEMILGMTTNPPPANDNNQSLSHAINEVLSETLEQTLALAEIETQCTAGDIESSSCQSTQQEVANVAQNDLTGQKEEESQDHPSNNSVAEVSSERTEDDDISKVGKEDSNSHTSHLAPRHNFRDIEIVHIAEEPSSPKTIDCKHISKLAEPLPDGECFDYAGSINPSMKMRKQRYQKKDEITEGISEIVKKKQYPMKKLNNLYNTLVASSKFRGLRRTRRHEDNDTGGTKIRIGPASTTERELVQCLMPKGKMCKNMMWLLSVALMYDWGSKTKVILDQTIITELLKKPKKCNHPYLCKKLSKLALQNVEQIFLPTLYDYHWILAVINPWKTQLKFMTLT